MQNNKDWSALFFLSFSLQLTAMQWCINFHIYAITNVYYCTGSITLFFNGDSLLVTLPTHNSPNLFHLTRYHLLFFSNHNTLSFRVLNMTPKLCSQNFTLSNTLSAAQHFLDRRRNTFFYLNSINNSLSLRVSHLSKF